MAQKERSERNRRKRQEKGLCTRCGYAKDAAGHDICKKRERIRREVSIAQGKCRSHKDRPAIAKGVCVECKFRTVAATAVGDRNLWEQVFAILEKQNYRCAYSGRLLVIGVNTSLDHITPVSRGGKKVLTNIHFVDKEINKLKTWLTHDEFVALSNKISQEQQPSPLLPIFREICNHLSHAV